MNEAFFDTNILIDWLDGRSEATAELKSHTRHRISRIVWAEVLAGEPSATRPAVQRLVEPFEIDEAVAALAADIRHGLRIKLLDALIYATARLHDAVLVTRNTRDFPSELPGVRVPYSL